MKDYNSTINLIEVEKNVIVSVKIWRVNANTDGSSLSLSPNAKATVHVEKIRQIISILNEIHLLES